MVFHPLRILHEHERSYGSTVQLKFATNALYSHAAVVVDDFRNTMDLNAIFLELQCPPISLRGRTLS